MAAPWVPLEVVPLRFRERFVFRSFWPGPKLVKQLGVLMLKLNAKDWQGCPTKTVYLSQFQCVAASGMNPAYVDITFRNLFELSLSDQVADFNEYDLGEWID